MSIFDGDKNPLNLQLPTLGGHVFWDTIKLEKGYKLQQHRGTDHCRILDQDDVRIAWGDEGPMRATFAELTGWGYSGKAKYGDVIGVHRAAGLYDHYGVYENDDCVYEYGQSENGTLSIHKTTLKAFIGSSDGYFILVFPEEYGALGKIHVNTSRQRFQIRVHNVASSNQLIPLWKRIITYKYKLYSPHETIARAKSRLGETRYNLFISNCEHFAIWCKTGLADSHQIDSINFFEKQ